MGRDESAAFGPFVSEGRKPATLPQERKEPHPMARFAMTVLALAGLSVIALQVNAQASMSELDTDGDGMFSFQELLVGYPTLTEETFTAIDVNGDGILDETEIAAAEEAGVMPEKAG